MKTKTATSSINTIRQVHHSDEVLNQLYAINSSRRQLLYNKRLQKHDFDGESVRVNRFKPKITATARQREATGYTTKQTVSTDARRSIVFDKQAAMLRCLLLAAEAIIMYDNQKLQEETALSRS